MVDYLKSSAVQAQRIINYSTNNSFVEDWQRQSVWASNNVRTE